MLADGGSPSLMPGRKSHAGFGGMTLRLARIPVVGIRADVDIVGYRPGIDGGDLLGKAAQHGCQSLEARIVGHAMAPFHLRSDICRERELTSVAA